MKRRTFLALGLTAALSIPFAMTAFADNGQYKPRQDVEFSGQTDFDYFYTYTDVDYKNYPFVNADYKCFSVVTPDGQRFYAAVKTMQYEYARAAFANKNVTFNGQYLQTAGDGSPIIDIRYFISSNADGSKKEESVGDYMWATAKYNNTCESIFRAFYSSYADAIVTIAEDSSYLELDTNPLNREREYDYVDIGLGRIQKVNKALGLPDWLYEEMVNTRALDGRQKENFDKVSVTWSYHPDHGLEVIYRKN